MERVADRAFDVAHALAVAEYDRLVAAGMRFHCLPVTMGRQRATYGRDPDGNVVELLEDL